MIWKTETASTTETHILDIPKLAVRFFIRKENKTGVLDFYNCSFLINSNNMFGSGMTDFYSEIVYCDGNLEDAKRILYSYYKDFVNESLKGFFDEQ